MPTYVCYTHQGQADNDTRTRLAVGIARIHHDATGTPVSLAQCIFSDLAAGDRFIGGQLAPDNGVWVYGHIRGDREAQRKHQIVSGITDLVSQVLQIPTSAVWVYLNELVRTDMIEFGHVLPLPGQEESWIAQLPSDLRDHLAALDQSASTRNAWGADPSQNR